MKHFSFTFDHLEFPPGICGPSSAIARDAETAQERLIAKIESLGGVHGNIIAIRAYSVFLIFLNGEIWCGQLIFDSSAEAENKANHIFEIGTGEAWGENTTLGFYSGKMTYSDWKAFQKEKYGLDFSRGCLELIDPHGNVLRTKDLGKG